MCRCISMPSWFRLVVIGGLFTGFSTICAAENAINEKSRQVYHPSKVEVMQVGDVPSHVVGIADASGLSFNDSGEVANYSGKIFFDLTNGTGPHQSYTVLTFEDKSTLISLNKGMTTARPDGTSTFEGTFTYIGGTGRFSGVKGGGSYTGKRMAPWALDGAADSFSDSVATYTLPSH